ncbi:carbohydrate binding family 9 domain-containing protein [Chloracidobacterium sp. A]|nr:carbohydrate binding family 9 domain-containing protein [Chloracidobacterium sp. A]
MPFRTAVGLLTCLLTWLLVATGTGRASAAGDTALTLPLLATPPVVDGRLEPDEWQVAVKVELPFQVEPGDNAPASEKTEAWLARDDQHLYLAFQAHDTDSQSIRARVTRRDDIDDDDYVIVMLDTYNDHVRAYRLSFNPLGIQSDGFINQEGDVDNTWDGIFRSKGRVTANGYVVEIAIPFKTLRFRAGKDAVWGLHLQRWIARKAERTSWQPVSRQVSNLLVQSGELRGLTTCGSVAHLMSFLSSSARSTTNDALTDGWPPSARPRPGLPSLSPSHPTSPSPRRPIPIFHRLKLIRRRSMSTSASYSFSRNVGPSFWKDRNSFGVWP